MACLVALVTFAVYLPSARYGFVGFDDGEYVFGNPIVTQGFSGTGIRWALFQPNAANYHPLTWLSLMTDVEFFGVNPHAMHLHNNALHAVTAGLFFLLLVRLLVTREREGAVDGHPSSRASLLISAAIAALFWSLHPLRVESVAWVSSRKDVLSGAFCMLGLLAWLANVRAHHGEGPRYTGWHVFGQSQGHTRLRGRCVAMLCLTFVCFVLGYGAKPTMMVYPAFLALVEWIETGRIRWKLMLILVGISGLFLGLTVMAQSDAIEMCVASPSARISNALISVFIYLRQVLYPARLCCFYPYNLPFATWQVLLGISAVLALVVSVIVFWRRAPFLAFGAAWYMVALVPVVGLIQVGSASHADRYTYLATPGLSVALAALLCSVFNGKRDRQAADRHFWPLRLTLHASLGAAVLAGLLISTLYYQSFWRDTVTLFERALAVTDRNGMAYNALADIYSRTPGKQQLAGEYWCKALAINRNCETLANVALLFLQTDPGRRDAAYALAQEALRSIAPGSADRSGSENELGQKHAFLAVGVYHLQRGEWRAAAHYLPLANMTGLFTRNPLYWEWVAIANYRTDQLDGAMDAIEHAILLMPNHERYTAMRDLIGKGIQARHGGGEP
jgi:hypothetical protein